MTIVVFHGSFNSYNQIIDFWLTDLDKLGHEIIFPHYPTDSYEDIAAGGENSAPTKQSYNSWLNVFEKYVQDLKKKQDLIFIGHSTGPLFILRVLQEYKIQINSAVFVCPFLSPLTKPSWQIKLINKTYYSDNLDFDTLKVLCPKSKVLCGENDPYVETENTIQFADKMKSEIIVVQNVGHMNKLGSGAIVAKACQDLVDT